MLRVDDSLCVLVPVLNRPQNVAPLVESWWRSETPGYLLFVCSSDDDEEQREVSRHQATAQVGSWTAVRATTWPAKIAECFGGIPGSDWWLLCADDVTFEPGWWDATERFRRSHVQVIGTNDGANPRCSVSGVHTTHPLVHRSFRAMGHPSSPVWPGYHHWFVDDELVWTAKARGVWAWCEDARITHHHPYFDDSVPWDDTYALGEAKRDEDAALWRERAQLLGLAVA